MKTVQAQCRVLALAIALAVALVASAPVQAQICRRSCQVGETRDARGCCIPPAPKKKRAKRKAKARSVKKKKKKKKPRKRVRRRAAKRVTHQPISAKSEPARAASPATPMRDEASPPGSERADAEASADAEFMALDAALQQQTKPRLTASRPPPVWPRWLLTGMGATIALGGGLLHWRAMSAGDAFDADFSLLCPEGCTTAQVPDRDQQLQRAELQVKLGAAAYAVGGMLTAVGLVWLLAARSLHSRSRQPGLSVHPWMADDQFGAAATMRF